MTKKQILSNQILTDIKLFLDDYGKISDAVDNNKVDNSDDLWHGLADDAVLIMPKVKNYLTMGDETNESE